MRNILFFIFCFCTAFNTSVAQKQVRIGIEWHSHSHVLPLLRNLERDDIQIVGIAESDRELLGRFSKAFSIDKNILFESLDEMLLKTKPEGVTTFSSIFDHLKVVKACTHLGADKKSHSNNQFNNYSIFSIWDTYRAEHPLLTLIAPDRIGDMIKSMLAIFDQQGHLPIWHLNANETGTMVGISSIHFIAEAYLKGFRNFIAERAFNAMKTTAMSDLRGLWTTWLQTKQVYFESSLLFIHSVPIDNRLDKNFEQV